MSGGELSAIEIKPTIFHNRRLQDDSIDVFNLLVIFVFVIVCFSLLRKQKRIYFLVFYLYQFLTPFVDPFDTHLIFPLLMLTIIEITCVTYLHVDLYCRISRTRVTIPHLHRRFPGHNL